MRIRTNSLDAFARREAVRKTKAITSEYGALLFSIFEVSCEIKTTILQYRCVKAFVVDSGEDIALGR
jgi:hypothetical protein